LIRLTRTLPDLKSLSLTPLIQFSFLLLSGRIKILTTDQEEQEGTSKLLAVILLLLLKIFRQLQVYQGCSVQRLRDIVNSALPEQSNEKNHFNIVR
jgi:hypothetical protein